MSDKLSQDLKLLEIDRTRKTGDTGGRRWMVAGILLAVAIVIGSLVVFLPDKVGFSTLGAKRREVEVTMVVRQPEANGNVVLTAGGYIIPRHRVEVSSKTTGRVEQLYVDKGDYVKAGQVLARLDDKEISAQLAQARATRRAKEARLEESVTGSRPQEIQRSQASLEEAEAELRTAKLNLERAKELSRGGVLSRQELDDAQNKHDVAAAKLKVARENLDLARLGPRKEQIDLARAELAEADATLRWWETQHENTIIRAPISGTILHRLIEKGEMLSTGFVSTRGAKSALVSIANLKELEVELDINEADIPRIHLGQSCTVSPDSYPDRKYRAAVREIAPEANRQKATIQVKVAISEPDEFLRPESNAKVHFLEETKSHSTESRILLPKTVILSTGSQPSVFLLKEGKATRQEIKTGKELWGQIEVVAGLSGGEQIIVRGLDGITDGEKVTVK